MAGIWDNRIYQSPKNSCPVFLQTNVHRSANWIFRICKHCSYHLACDKTDVCVRSFIINFFPFIFNYNFTATTAAVEGKMSKTLKKIMKKLVVEEAREEIAVADAKLGNAIKVWIEKHSQIGLLVLWLCVWDDSFICQMITMLNCKSVFILYIITNLTIYT